MKTDLKKVLSISGQSGLFYYVAQAKNGIIAESFSTKSRSVFGATARVTSLADRSIYTVNEEVALRKVLEDMHAILGEEQAPSQKSNPNDIKAFFSKAIPEYDQDRFYVSHMKKVLEWYNLLLQYASLDFEDEESESEEAQTQDVEAKENKQASKANAAASAKSVKATSAKAASANAAAAKKTTKSVQRKAN